MLLNRGGPLRWFASISLSLWCVAASAQLTIESDVIYGRKDGMALTYDVLKPESANGAAVIFMMSGGWYSSWSPPSGWHFASQICLVLGLL